MDGQDLVSARGEGIFDEQAVRARESRRLREYEINGRIKIQQSKERGRADKISVPRHRSKQEKLKKASIGLIVCGTSIRAKHVKCVPYVQSVCLTH